MHPFFKVGHIILNLQSKCWGLHGDFLGIDQDKMYVMSLQMHFRNTRDDFVCLVIHETFLYKFLLPFFMPEYKLLQSKLSWCRHRCVVVESCHFQFIDFEKWPKAVFTSCKKHKYPREMYNGNKYGDFVPNVFVFSPNGTFIFLFLSVLGQWMTV